MATASVTKSEMGRPTVATHRVERSLPAILGAVVVPAVLLGLWEMAGRFNLVDVRFVPTPSAILGAMIRLMSSGELPASGLKTLLRVGQGYAIGAGLGVVLGLAYGLWAPLRRFGGTLVELARPIPGVTLIPLTILWFGLGEAAKVSIVSWAVFFPVFLNAVLGFRSIPPILVQAARVTEIRGWRLFWKVLLPAAIPAIFTGLRLSIGYALMSTAAVEMILGPDGLGAEIIDAQRTFRIPEMFAAIVAFAGLGAMSAIGLLQVERLLLSYRR